MLHTEKIANKLEQLSIQFDMEGADNEESFFFVKENVHFQVYHADGSYVFEASIKVEEFGFMELKEISIREMKTLRSLEKFINENVVIGMEKLAELNEEECEEIEEDTMEETETTSNDSSMKMNGSYKCNECNAEIFNKHNDHCPSCGSYDVSKINENSAIENFKKQTLQKPEIEMDLTREEIMEQLKIAFEKMAMMEYCYMKHTGNHLLNEFHSKFTFTSPYEVKIFNAYHNEDLQRMEWLVENGDANLKNMNARLNIIKELHKQIAIFNAHEMISRGINAKQIQEEYEQAMKETEEALHETITNEHGVTITKEELEKLEQDTQQAIETYKHFNMKQEAKDLAKHCYDVSHSLELYINSNLVIDVAKNHHFNLADFVYQIVLAYNEISPIVTPVASKVETKQAETTPFINHLFNTMDEYFDEMQAEGNTFIGTHATKTITIVDTLPIMCYMDDEWTNERAEFEAFEEWEVTDFIDNKLS